MAITLLKPFNLDSTGNYTFNKVTATTAVDFTSASNVSLGNVANIKITGGSSGYVLSTDGAGNVSWISNIFSTIANGNSNVNIPSANGNVTISSAGNSNIVIVTGTGVNVNGTLNATGNANVGNIGATNANITAMTATGNIVVGNANLGNLATANFFSGSGNLLSNIQGANVTGAVSSATTAGTVTTAAQPNITSLGTLTSLIVSGNANISGTANLTGNLFVGTDPSPKNINLIGNFLVSGVAAISDTRAGNFTGITSNGTIDFSSASNVTLGSNANVHISGGSAGYILTTNGSGALSWSAPTSGVAGSNTQVQFNDGGSAFGASANFTFDKSSNTLTVDKISGNGALLTAITGGNVTGQVANALIAGTVYTAAQPNITSVGTLSSLSVTANITAGNVTGANLISANYLTGTLTTASQPNITSVGTLTSITTDANGNITLSGSQSQITGANLVSASYLTGTLTTASQPNVTSLGTLTSLTVSGNANAGNFNTSGTLTAGDATITGNLTVNGTTIYANVTTLNVKDPIIEMGGNPNGTPLSSNDGKDRGTLLHYYSGSAIDAFMGWDNSNAEFAFGSNVSVSSEVVTWNSLGNVRAGYFLGNGSQLTGIVPNSNYANYAGDVVNSSQSNITSLGNLTTLNVSATVNATSFTSNVSTGTAPLSVQSTTKVANLNADLLDGYDTSTSATANTVTVRDANGNITANFFTGNGAYLTGITATPGGSNTQLQFNDGGTLSGATGFTYDKTNNAVAANGTITGTRLISNIATGTAPLTVSSTTLVSNLNADLLDGYNTATAATATTVVVRDANANITANNITGTLTTASQTNITSVGTLSSLSVTANITSGNANLGNLASANYFSGNGYYLTGINSLKFTSSTSLPSSPTPGDEWYDQNNDIIYKYIYDGTTYTWIDISSGFLTATTAATANTLALRDANGNITANYFIGTFVGSGNSSAGNMTISGVLTVTGNISGGNVSTSGQLISTVSTGTAPIVVNSTTLVANLYAARANVSDYGAVSAQTTGTFYPTFVNSNSTGNYALGSNTNINVNVATGAFNSTLLGGTLTTAAQPNITSVSTSFTGLTFTANGNITLSGSVSQITGANLISGTYLTGTLTTAAQPNITSLGTMNNITMGGSNSISGGNLLSANYVTGTLTTAAQPNITSLGTMTNITMAGPNSISGGNLLSANYVTGTLTTAAQPNITSVSTSFTGLTFTANGNVTLSGSASQITGANLISGTYLTGTLTTAAQPNITSVGTLTGLASNGTVNFTNASNVSLGSNTIVKITGGTSGQYLYTDGAGNLSWGTVSTTGITNGTSNVTIPSSGGNIILVAGGTTTGTITSTGANITGYANITGNVTAGNVSGGNLVSANYFTGTLTTAAQPNITSVGSLTGLTVSNSSGVVNFITTANVSLGAVGNLHITGGTPGQVLQTDGSGGLSWSTVSATPGGSNTFVQFNDGGSFGGNTNLTFNKSTTTLTANNLSVNYLTTLGDVSNVKIYGGTANYVLQTDGAGNLSWNAAGGGSGTGIANGTSNINIATANGNITVGVGGTANIAVFTSTGVELGSNANVKITGGSLGQALTTDGAGNLSWTTAGAPTTYDFDDLSPGVDGFTGTFPLLYNQDIVTSVTDPYALLVVVNGATQAAWVYNTDVVWQNFILGTKKGYTIITAGYLTFADPPPAGSDILVRTYTGSQNTVTKKYPFSAADIMLGF